MHNEQVEDRKPGIKIIYTLVIHTHMHAHRQTYDLAEVSAFPLYNRSWKC